MTTSVEVSVEASINSGQKGQEVTLYRRSERIIQRVPGERADEVYIYTLASDITAYLLDSHRVRGALSNVCVYDYSCLI